MENKKKSIDLALHETREQLINLINQSGLPIGVTIMLLKEIVSIAEVKYTQVVQEEIKEMQKQQSE